MLTMKRVTRERLAQYWALPRVKETESIVNTQGNLSTFFPSTFPWYKSQASHAWFARNAFVSHRFSPQITMQYLVKLAFNYLGSAVVALDEPWLGVYIGKGNFIGPVVLVPCVWKRRESRFHSGSGEGERTSLLPAPRRSQALRAGMTSVRMCESNEHS